MATHLDLEEQEQLAELKHFWNTYGNLISWVLIAVLGAYAAWNGWQYWQRHQATQAAALYDEVERSVASRDIQRMQRSLSDMQERFASSMQAQQASQLVAKALAEQGKTTEAKAAWGWLVQKATDPAYADVARLRLASQAMQDKQYDQALEQLKGVSQAMQGLAADMQGDVLQLQGKQAEAVAAYQKAWSQLPQNTPYRRLLQAKLNALGAEPATAVEGKS
ncbi:MAG: hypothetical protein RLZ63_532 [Pseudomonadota bacterium]|jgi:predicted negative regulator of RcsB-dependent stress response